MSDVRQWVIGRAPDCDIVMAQPEVSGRHCRLTRESGQWFLEDLRSRNGTFVNGQRLPSNTPTPVNYSDAVSLGGIPMPWPERPSIPAPQLKKTVLVVPPSIPEPEQRSASRSQTPITLSRPILPPAVPTSKKTGNRLGIAIVLFGVALFFGILIYLFWPIDESKPSDKPTEKAKADKQEKSQPFSENFGKAAKENQALPEGWTGTDVAVVTDEMKRACLEPTLARQGIGVAILPSVPALKSDFTISGDAFVYPSLMVVMEGDGPRLAVNIDWQGFVKINDNIQRRPAKMNRNHAFMYKIVRRNKTISVFLNDDIASTALINDLTTINRIQVGLGSYGGRSDTGHSRLYSIEVKHD